MRFAAHPTSHETSELVTNPDNNGVTASGWFDVAGFEIGDECNFLFGTPQDQSGQLFSNSSFFSSGGGCLQHA